MASLPPRHSAAGRTRSSDQESSRNTYNLRSSAGSNNDTQRAEPSVTSESFLLNRSISTEPDRAPEPTTTEEDVKDAQARSQRAQTEESVATQEPRKCWICYTDETEESPHNVDWRSPCPCALTAHEACLLDWLAELESPQSRKRGRGDSKMQCPQCKSEIIISRPRSYVVDFVRACEKLAGKLVLPGLVFTVAGTVWAGCCAHGVYSMYLIFGTEDAQRIFDHGGEGTWSPARNVGIPFIPLALFFSRTRYADSLLPAVPVLFFATHNPTDLEVQGANMWPPSAAMTFAALPYVKSIYSAVYERLFGQLERKWIADIQPRSGEDAGAEGQRQGGGQRHAALGEVGDGQILMEFDLELQLGMGGDEQQDHDIPADVPDVPIDNIHGDADQAQQNQGAGNRDRQILGRHRDELIHDTSTFAETILGALLFPAISASMGGLLKLTLPKSWTTAASTPERGKAGLLQSRWGRSVIGGCLFVLLKDALVLYCRWKLAETHRKRHVLNYDRTKQKKKQTVQ